MYRERSGDYRILYIERRSPEEVIILDIDDRKDVYRMPRTKAAPADEARMKESDFDGMIKGALNVPPPEKEAPKKTAKRLSAHPAR